MFIEKISPQKFNCPVRDKTWALRLLMNFFLADATFRPYGTTGCSGWLLL